MKWPTEEIKITAIAPLIISASRATDIPAFYGDWFIKRLINERYIMWKNPFSGQYIPISLSKVRLIVFWSKNPKPFIKHLQLLNEKQYNYYFQFTLNNYEKEKFEPNVPPLNQRIETFIELSEKIGKEKVIWRFDPVLITSSLDIEEIAKRIEYIGDRLKNYTNKLVFSFADIGIYKRVEKNLKKRNINYIEFTHDKMVEFAKLLSQLNKKWNLELATCAEEIDLSYLGINHNKCIDEELIVKLFHDDKVLMDFLNIKIIGSDSFNSIQYEKTKNLKDTGQRKLCGCIISKDIGEYNTCKHRCVYCYAKYNKAEVFKNYQRHELNNSSSTITGNLK